jgi:hypothetical protein
MGDPKPQASWGDRDVTVWLAIAGLFSCVVSVVVCAGLSMSGAGLRDAATPARRVEVPTPTPVACPAVPAGWVEVFSDEFESDDNGWPTGSGDDQYAKTNLSVTEGVLHTYTRAHQSVYYYWYPHKIDSLEDFYLKTNVRQVSGPADANYGVVFRMAGWNHYLYRIDDSGGISIAKRTTNSWDSLRDSSASAIRPGEYNELVVLGQGSRFKFCVNQQLVAEVEDESYPHGGFGIALGLYQAEDEAVIEYDDFEVYAPAK